jgi:hypothetical protein
MSSPSDGVVAGSSRGLDDSVQIWALAAEAMDSFAVAVYLRGLGSDPVATQPSEIVLKRAQDFLFTGHAPEAFRVLVQLHGVELPDPVPVNEQTLTIVACLAANGDDAAYRRLLSVAAVNRAWLPTYLLGAAAESRGDKDLSDQAWLSVVTNHGLLTSYTFPRWAVATISRRDRHSRDEAFVSVLTVAQGCSNLPHDLALDPEPVLATVTSLLERGDEAGARLLLLAIERTQPPVSSLKARQADLRPLGLSAYRWKVAALLGIGLALVPFGYLGLILIALGRRLWFSRVRFPGLALVDSQVWRMLATSHTDPSTGVGPLRHQDVNALMALVVFGAFIAGIPVSVGMLELLAALTGTSVLPEGIQVLVWATGLITLPVLTLFLLTWGRRRYQQRRLRFTRRRARARWASEANRCHCLHESVYTDEQALLYAEHHLQPLPLPPAQTSRLQVPDTTTQVLSCPQTRIRWIALDVTAGRAGLLLRGDIPPDPSTPQNALTGMYL